MSLGKRLAARLPDRWQLELKRLHFARQIHRSTFVSGEPEFRMLDRLVAPGDWIIDIGANVGHYTRRFSELVGPQGRVLAFEPVPTTFALLAANVQLSPVANVSLVNAAVSDRLGVVGMALPTFATGLTNYYEAHISADAGDGPNVLTLCIDTLGIDRRIALVKIDAEGHEAQVLAGMQRLIAAHRPLLIVETRSADVVARLQSLGYAAERLPGSPNVLLRPQA
jgi:FkbM family methyltransferase